MGKAPIICAERGKFGKRGHSGGKIGKVQSRLRDASCQGGSIPGQMAQCGASVIAARCIGCRSALHRHMQRAAFSACPLCHFPRIRFPKSSHAAGRPGHCARDCRWSAVPSPAYWHPAHGACCSGPPAASVRRGSSSAPRGCRGASRHRGKSAPSPPRAWAGTRSCRFGSRPDGHNPPLPRGPARAWEGRGGLPGAGRSQYH